MLPAHGRQGLGAVRAEPSNPRGILGGKATELGRLLMPSRTKIRDDKAGDMGLVHFCRRAWICTDTCPSNLADTSQCKSLEPLSASKAPAKCLFARLAMLEEQGLASRHVLLERPCSCSRDICICTDAYRYMCTYMCIYDYTHINMCTYIYIYTHVCTAFSLTRLAMQRHALLVRAFWRARSQRRHLGMSCPARNFAGN